MRRRAALGAFLAVPGLARAQPGAPIRLLVNGTPGSIADILCRTLAEGLREGLGRPVVPDKRSGAGGFAAVLGARGQPADGSLLVQANIDLTALAPLVFRRPSTRMPSWRRSATSPSHRSGSRSAAMHPVGGTLQGWLAAMRARGGGEVAVNSATGLPRFMVQRLLSVSGVPLTPVIYRGSGAMLPDLEAGHVPAGLTIGGEFIEQHRAGRLRLLAQSLGEGRWRRRCRGSTSRGWRISLPVPGTPSSPRPACRSRAPK